MSACMSRLRFSFSVLRFSKTHNNVFTLFSSTFSSEISRNETLPVEYTLNVSSERNEQNEEKKILNVAIIGTPNAGKSTLINQIVGRRVFAISKKVHTTQCRARAVHVIGNTQLVFLDTPGLVTQTESVRFKLQKNFLSDGEKAIMSADVIGVMHDVSNNFTKSKLDPKILRLLHLYPKKNAVLILNKIDCLKNKRTLLDLADKLTCKQLSPKAFDLDKNSPESEKISEMKIARMIKKESGWKGFQEVFMVSAIEGFGVGDILEYLLRMARPGRWVFPEDVFTDQEPRRIIEEAVRSKLLDYIPQEMPYIVKVQLEYFEQNKDYITTVVLVICPSERVEKLIRGAKDGKIRIITTETTEDLENTFQQNINLKIVVTNKDSRSKL